MYQIENLLKEIRDSKEALARIENAIPQLKMNPVTVYIAGNTFTNALVEGKLISHHLEDLLVKVKEHYKAKHNVLTEHKTMLDKLAQSLVADADKA